MEVLVQKLFGSDPLFGAGILVLCANILFFITVAAILYFTIKSRARAEKKYENGIKELLPVLTDIIFLENYKRIKELKHQLTEASLKDAASDILINLSMNFRGDECEKIKLIFRELGLFDDRFNLFKKTGEMKYFRQLLLFGGADDFENMIRLLSVANGESKRDLLIHVLGKGDVQLFWAINDQVSSLSEWDQLIVIEKLYKRPGFHMFDQQFPLHLKDDNSKLFILRLIRRFNLIQHHPLLLFFLSDSVKIESEIINIVEDFPTDPNVVLLKSMFPCKDPMNNRRVHRILKSYGDETDLKEIDTKLNEWQTVQFNLAPPFLN